MGQPPPFGGQVIGVFKCDIKRPIGKLISVEFSGPAGAIILHLSAEDAEYYTEGQSYQFSATRP